MKGQISGVNHDAVRAYETAHRLVARKAAAEGIALLKNEGGLLPLPAGKTVALYGSGAVFPIKGGSGSGDVNAREVVSVWEGMKAAGFAVVNEDWLADYKTEYENAHLAWRDAIWGKIDDWEDQNIPPHMRMFRAYSSTPFNPPTGAAPEGGDADTAVYVLSRTAGEGADRFAAPGDYYLTEEEKAFLTKLNAAYPYIVLVLNIGGLIDLGFVDDYPHIQSILYANQPGMEAGNAIADVIGGAATPSGKLTDSWAERYEDYPNSKTFSHNNGNVQKEYYEEGIYVGYRYFDTFGVPVRYGFGFGLSYTAFDIRFEGLRKENGALLFSASVTNTGTKYAGKEVVQLYAACPQEKRDRELRRLVGFRKTKLLAPGESETVEIAVPLDLLSSYDEALPGWTIDKGTYVFTLGNSLENSAVAASANAEAELLVEKTQHICPLRDELAELAPDASKVAALRQKLVNAAAGKPCVALTAEDVTPRTVEYGGAYADTPQKVRDFVDTLATEQLISLATGDLSVGQGSIIGAAGSRVPGSAAQTSPCAEEQGLEDVVLADGPAGLRLNREYRLLNGQPIKESFEKSIENGFLFRGEEPTEGEKYYQYCTAIPVGTLLAMSWDPEVLIACGKAVAEEMNEFGVELWLAPGMNIHRNPLCGRNFEYFAEDPLLSGIMAAAMTDGVQSVPGCGTTIKHFACNSQEDNRKFSDSILTERTLREIYLKGFEIAVKASQPKAIMTSYNLVNGVHAANSFDLCTKAARNEWGFRGFIMTDWSTTNDGPECTASGCMRAGNDIVMPGKPMDHDNLREELADGRLPLADLKRSIARTVNTIWNLRR